MRPTPFVLRRVVDPSTARRRREHYAALLESLAPLVTAPFHELPAGASPFMSPIDVPQKTRVSARLEGPLSPQSTSGR
jgi:hypothetical protein